MSDTLSITDNRTGKIYEIPITHDTIRALELRQIKVNDDDFGMMSYDPAFGNTASCQSSVTFIDGGKGILRYRGYPIEQLAEKCNFAQVAYLVLNGELPDEAQQAEFSANIAQYATPPDTVKSVVRAFPQDAHPMGMLVSALGALSTCYPDAKDVLDPACRQLQCFRLLGQIAVVGAYIHRHVHGLEFVDPEPGLSYGANFLNMVFKGTDQEAHLTGDVLERAMEVLLILHADHEQNCSANAMRSIGSSQADPFVAMAGATGALYGPLHGGANEKVLRQLNEIGATDHIPKFIEQVKAGERLLMGFGHRVYKNYDPRARVICQTAGRVFDVTGRNPLIDIAMELERIALEDEYFVKRKLYPNVDFYSGIIYQAMGFPTPYFTVLFAIGRAVGWLAQWQELMEDKEQRIARPRQVYLGPDTRAVP